MKKLVFSLCLILALICASIISSICDGGAQVAGRRVPIADSTIHLTDGTVDEADLSATNSPTDNYILSYDDATKTFTWIAAAGGDANKSDIHDTIDVHWSAFTTDNNTQLSEEQVEDYAGTMVDGGTETRIAVTYTDGGAGAGLFNFVVDDMNDDVPESGDFGGAADLDADGGITSGVIDTVDLTDAEFWEYVQDHAGGMFTGNTETRITVTYNEDGTVDFVVDDMNDDQPDDDSEVPDAITVTGYMQDGDINTFSELQSWVSDKTLVNEEDIFTIDGDWVNTANPWADNEVADDITIDKADSTVALPDSIVGTALKIDRMAAVQRLNADSIGISGDLIADLKGVGLTVTSNVLHVERAWIWNFIDTTTSKIPTATSADNVADADYGDVTVSSGVWAVEDESHDHTTTTISGLDVSDDINLTAGDHITLTDDDLDVDDDFVLNSESDVMTGTLTADGLTLGANEDITLGSETLDHDGTDFVFSDDLKVTGIIVSSDTLTKSFVIQAPDSDHDFPFWMTPKAITIIAASGVCIAGTNVVGVFMEYDNDAANPVVCNSSDWTFTTGEERTTSLSNPSIDAGDYLGWKTTSVSGSVDFFTITIEYTQP